jgi:hypothetical protein
VTEIPAADRALPATALDNPTVSPEMAAITPVSPGGGGARVARVSAWVPVDPFASQTRDWSCSSGFAAGGVYRDVRGGSEAVVAARVQGLRVQVDTPGEVPGECVRWSDAVDPR